MVPASDSAAVTSARRAFAPCRYQGLVPIPGSGRLADGATVSHDCSQLK